MNPSTILIRTVLGVALAAQALAQAPAAPQVETAQDGRPTGNPYRLEPWFDDYPVELTLPYPASAQVYERSRRQALEKVVANLQGNVSRESWQMATEFFDRAPEDAIEPLIAAMDRGFGQPAMQDVVKNTIEAMGRVRSVECDEALRRGLEHPGLVVRQAVFAALAGSGSEETIRRTFPLFLTSMDGQGRKSWLRAARQRLGEEAVGMFQQLMQPDTPMQVRDQVVVETMEMAPADAAMVLEGLWPHATGNFKILIAGVFHAAGRASGTAHLSQSLQDADPKVVVHTLNNLQQRGPGVLLDDVLALLEHPNADVRLQVANLLTSVAGDQATNALERLTAPDQPLEIRMVAMRELTKRGRSEAVTFLLSEVGTATGTRLTVQLRMLGASGDPRCVPLFVERVKSSPPEEGREFLQALAFSGAPGAASAMVDLFLDEERAVAGSDRAGGQLTTINYIPILLANLRGMEDELVAAWDRIPPADHVRRAQYLQALVSIAADRTDPKIVEPIVELLRRMLFDATAAPQLRIQALNALTRKFLTLSDAMRLKRLQEPIGDRESPNMRALFKDFLFEYF